MSTDSGVSELLLRWRDLREEGRCVSVEDLCAGQPHLAAELRRRIVAVEAMEARFGMGTPTDDSPASARAPALCAATLSDRDRNGDVPTAVDQIAIPGYEILGVLDKGGMGIVYKARHLQLKRLVALKMIRGESHAKPQQLARFRAEAEAVAQLQHPHIVQIYDVGESDGRPYFAMELVEGGNLAQKVAGQPVTPRQAAELVATLADTIHAAHLRGIIHRDLKPANILLQNAEVRMQNAEGNTRSPPSDFCILTSDFVPKIGDFGLAKRLNSESGLSGVNGQTQSGAILGTPCYMAPEQAQGKTNEIGPRVDVYALGAILYELLTGHPPFTGTSPLDTLLHVVSSDPVPPSREQPKVPRDLETICLKCLEKVPSRRYPTAQALADDLRRFLDGRPITARSISPWRRVYKWAQRRPELAALLSVLLLAAIMGVALWSQYRAREESRLTAVQLAPRARLILRQYCYHCHGLDPASTDGDMDILDYDLLLNSGRNLVVPHDTEGSLLIHRSGDNSMPPEDEEEFPRLAGDQSEVLKNWVAGGAPRFPDPGPEELNRPTPTPLSVQVKQIFKERCHECHRAGNVMNGIKILNHDLLVAKRKVVVAGNAEQSRLYQLLVTTNPKKIMPPLNKPQLTPKEIDTIRLWIAEGAPPFPLTRVAKEPAKP